GPDAPFGRVVGPSSPAPLLVGEGRRAVTSRGEGHCWRVSYGSLRTGDRLVEPASIAARVAHGGRGGRRLAPYRRRDSRGASPGPAARRHAHAIRGGRDTGGRRRQPFGAEMGGTRAADPGQLDPDAGHCRWQSLHV